MNIEFKGDHDDWFLVWEAIRTQEHMTFLASSEDLRRQVLAAYNRIMDANKVREVIE